MQGPGCCLRPLPSPPGSVCMCVHSSRRCPGFPADADSVAGGEGRHPTLGGVSGLLFEDVPGGITLFAKAKLAVSFATSWPSDPGHISSSNWISFLSSRSRDLAQGLCEFLESRDWSARSHVSSGAPPASGKSLPRAGVSPEDDQHPWGGTWVVAGLGGEQGGWESGQTQGGPPAFNASKRWTETRPWPLVPEVLKSRERSRSRASHSWEMSKSNPCGFSFPKAASFPTDVKPPHPRRPLGRPGAGQHLLPTPSVGTGFLPGQPSRKCWKLPPICLQNPAPSSVGMKGP